MELILTFMILAFTIFLFMSNRIRADLVGIFALLAFVLTGILKPEEALAGFSNSVVIMIAGLFIVGAGILRTGLAKKASNLLLYWTGNSEKKLFLLLLVLVAAVGAFMSNTGTVAIMLPVVISVALSMKTSSSKFLIPLSYIASLSGLLTLIASPPNLIVSQILMENGFERLRFFDITPIGVTAVIIGIIYLFVVRNVLLPSSDKRTQIMNHQLSPKELIQNYHLEDNLHRLQVLDSSPIVDKQLSELKIPANYHLCILKIDRKAGEGRNLLPITYQEMAGPRSVVHGKDVLYVQGARSQVEKMANDYQLIFKKDQTKNEELVSSQLGIAEVLLTPNSSLINETIGGIGFREKFNLNIIGINRKGNYILKDMSNIRLRFGDALLVQGSWEEIELLSRETMNVVVVGQPMEHASFASANGKAPIAGGIMLLMVILMIFEVFPSVISVLIGAVLMLITGCLRNMDDAYSQINWESIVLIACMLPMATALEKTGGMVMLSEGIIELLGGYGPIGVLAGIYFITMVFGQFISNTATAVLFAPIAMNAALAIGVSPYPFLITVAAAASMAFATPVASPTNAMVMTAGGYKFSDFMKIGIPLQLIMYLIMMLIIPFIFPF
ncbi:di/tricarboxylate transporter [Cytobacillus eiseniae]|uniref:Di/tricarboxylate transporter n=1 Tax=Cytobacillus eiseniae TaxID=762947 RepID=A0ABS4R9G2_9BACI|nr:SLC13 family permease [Cytobacillus eiseniae]MBP2239532.1 di/tricarboxylate transporter [Cytobacillus eiseniae]